MRTGGTFVVVVLLTALTGACGSATSAVTVQDSTVARAGLATKAAGTAHLTLSVTTKGVTVQGQGDADLAHKRFEASVDAAGTTLDEVLADHVLYLRSSAFTAQLDPGKTYVAEDLSKITMATYGVGIDDLSSGNDPLGSLDQLSSTSGISRKGTDTIDGVSCLHYAGKIDLGRRADAETDPAKKAAYQKIAKSTHGKIGLDVWIGPDGLIRQLHEDVPSITVGSITTPKISLTLGFSRFGEKVTIAVPPAAETQDVTQQAIDQITRS